MVPFTAQANQRLRDWMQLFLYDFHVRRAATKSWNKRVWKNFFVADTNVKLDYIDYLEEAQRKSSLGPNFTSAIVIVGAQRRRPFELLKFARHFTESLATGTQRIVTIESTITVLLAGSRAS